MVRAASRDGTSVLVATPHVRDDYPAVGPETISAALGQLTRALPGEPAIEIAPGAEIDLGAAGRLSDAQLARLSLGGRGSDLLVETPYGLLAPGFEQALFALRSRGFRLLLAHPERNPTFQNDPARLAAIVQGGVLVQVTAGSLTRSRRRSRSARLARRLVRDGLAHAIASDAHPERVAPRSRLSEGAAAAAGESGAATAEWLVTEAPAAILAGARLPPRPAARTPRRFGFGRRPTRPA